MKSYMGHRCGCCYCVSPPQASYPAQGRSAVGKALAVWQAPVTNSNSFWSPCHGGFKWFDFIWEYHKSIPILPIIFFEPPWLKRVPVQEPPWSPSNPGRTISIHLWQWIMWITLICKVFLIMICRCTDSKSFWMIQTMHFGLTSSITSDTWVSLLREP